MTRQLVALISIFATTVAAGADIHWIGTWATAAQAARPERVETFRAQTLRLIVHVSAGGQSFRVRLSNAYGTEPLVIGGARLARRAMGAEIVPRSDRLLTFQGRPTATIPAGAEYVSDAVDLDVPALSDLAVSLWLPEATRATTAHVLALQTNYLAEGDAAAMTRLSVAKTLSSWPFLTGVDVVASRHTASIVAFGSSLTDGDGTTENANRRWPDVLAARLWKAAGQTVTPGVLNEGLIGNRLLFDSPNNPDSPFGPMLGESGLKRFDRDVLDRPGVRHVVVCLGVNDILFPAFPFTPLAETITADALIAGYRDLIARGHARGLRVIGTTIPPFEGARFDEIELYTPDRERTRSAVNEWIRKSGAFDGVIDFDEAVRDPERPTRLLPAYSSEDHLHPNDAGSVAQAKIIRLELFR